MEPFNPIKTERKQINGIALTPDTLLRFREKTSLALMFLFLADAKLAEAEDVLRANDVWKLDLKKEVNVAINYVRTLTTKAEKELDSDKVGGLFYADTELLGKMADALMQCDLSKDDEINLLSYVRNNYGRKKNNA